ncbi:cobyric acid synthase [Phyllobacterium sp. 628]|uniref:cobyric acid synthase n=1 Tax=Phyllobacterium sp. 628 TaxID=2718938 RepID=UPI001662626B|nr:cobyric acid synthase [Phyllobacterium sp. 628]QND53533.1 cobyric acid synthase [Phyllobacterium sp. 628]
MTHAIMLQGTGSDVGKSVLVAGLCRLARNRGLKVRPFKPQNMSNNAAVSDDGGEIGRAQWLQAVACGVSSSVHMNPVLLKPQSETGSQIIVQGKVWGQAKGRDYQKFKAQLLDAVMASWDIVREGADLVIVEGAGSPAEINLRAGDIANMGFATRTNVPVVLVGDIDRGGVIASIVGTHAILQPEDRAMIAGYLINKFRGDISLFDDGLKSITQFTGWPSFGVVPWLKDAARLPAEDSVVLERLVKGEGRALKIAVPVLDRIANFDDLDPLMAEPQVEVVMVRSGERLPADAGLVIIPGSKSTISDLMRFRENGWDKDLDLHRRRGGHIIGICGGFQMLGRIVRDPDGIEGSLTETEGLGLLDIDTVMEPEKTVRNVEAHSLQFDLPLNGYEIHLGRTTGPDCANPVARINGVDDGAISGDGKVFGTYLHGLFAADKFRAALLGTMGIAADEFDYRAGVDAALDSIAGQLETVLDVDALLACAGVRGSSFDKLTMRESGAVKPI